MQQGSRPEGERGTWQPSRPSWVRSIPQTSGRPTCTSTSSSSTRTCSRTTRRSGAARTTAWPMPSASSRPSPPRGSAASPTRPSSGLGRYIPRIQRIAEQVPELQHRRRHRLLHLRPGAVLLLLPGAGAVGRGGHGGARPDGGHVRRRHHRGHRRHGGQGRLPQVRHRPSGHDRRRGPGHARRGPGAPHHGRTHHRAHPSGFPDRPGGEGAPVRRGGRRPHPGGVGPFRRQRRRRASRARWPTRASFSAWTASGSTWRRPSKPGPTRWSRCAAAATPIAWCSRTMRPATSTGSTPTCWR